MLPRLKDAMWECEKTVISNSVVYTIFNLDILTNRKKLRRPIKKKTKRVSKALNVVCKEFASDL